MISALAKEFFSGAGASVRFSAIDPEMGALSSGPAPIFTYVRDCRGSVEIAIGDARVNLGYALVYPVAMIVKVVVAPLIGRF